MAKSYLCALIAISCVTLAPFADATGRTIGFGVSLDGEQAGTDSPATGNGSVILDTEENLLSWEIAFDASALVGGPRSITEVAMYVGVRGEDGLLTDPPGSLVVGRYAQSPLIGSAIITEDIAQKVQAGEVHVSMRTETFPAGEIRGQLVQDRVMILPAKDNTLYESASGSTSNGAGQHIFCGRSNDSDLKRAVITFDVGSAGIPRGSIITAAVLTLTMTRSEAGPQPVALHRLMADWGEGVSDARENEGSGAEARTGDATWQHTFFNTAFWANAGGDFSAEPSASQTVGGRGAYDWESSTMLEDVQDWFEDPQENFGWLLLGDETRNRTTKRFGSRENEEAFPVLTVRYEPPQCQYALAGDLNNDCLVDFLDLALMLSNWLVDCSETPEHPACLPR